MAIINCAWCSAPFTPNHGNSTYHLPECEKSAKADRQQKRRAPIARFIQILIRNHEIIEKLNQAGYSADRSPPIPR